MFFGCTQTNSQLPVSNSSVNTSVPNFFNPDKSGAFIRENRSPVEGQILAEINDSDGRIPILYFYSSHCSACAEVAPLMMEVEKYFENETRFVKYDVSTDAGFAGYNKFAADVGIPSNARYVPVVLIGNKTLTGIWEIKRENVYLEFFKLTNWSG